MRFVYQIFLKGLITLLPIAITIYLLVWVAAAFESFVGQPLKGTLPEVFGYPGAALLFAVAFIFVIGLLVNNYVTHRLIRWLEHQLEVIPIFRSIYAPIRDITQMFDKTSKSDGHQRVVLAKPYGPDGAEVLGLITRESFSDLSIETNSTSGTNGTGDAVAVFIPFSYAMGGFTILLPRTSIRETKLNADRALQLALTAWIKATKD